MKVNLSEYGTFNMSNPPVASEMYSLRGCLSDLSVSSWFDSSLDEMRDPKKQKKNNTSVLKSAVADGSFLCIRSLPVETILMFMSPTLEPMKEGQITLLPLWAR